MRLAAIVYFFCGLSVLAADRALATTPPPIPKPAVPDPVLDTLGTMSTEAERACDAASFSGIQGSMGGQAAQALARAQVRLVRHEKRYPAQKGRRDRGDPLDPVHQALVDDVKAWQDYMQGVNDMRFEPQACSRAGFGEGFYYIPGTDTKLRIDGYGGAANRFIGKDAGLGVVVAPGDPFFLKYPGRIALSEGGANFDIRSGDRMHNFGLSYGRGSDRTSAVEPNGGNAIGFVSGDPADPGLNFGAFGFSATGKVSLDNFGLSYKSMQKFNLDNGWGWGWGSEAEEELRESYKWFGWVATFNYSALDYSGHLQRTPDPNDVYVDVNHSLDSYRVMFGPAISGRRMLSSSVYLLGQADVQAGLMRSSLDTREVICALCGGAPTEVNLSDSKTSLAWSVGAKVGIGATLAPGLDARITAGVRWGNRHTNDVRQNPGDHGTRVGSATGHDWDVWFSLSRAFETAP